MTQEYDTWTAMAGFAIDASPIPEETLNFELPDSDAMLISLGGRYQLNESWEVGMSALVDMKENRTVKNETVDGEFTNAKAYLITLGLEYTF